MIVSSDEKVHNYRKPIMKEKSSVENLIVMQSHDKRARDRELVEAQRRSNAMVQDFDTVVFGANKL